MSTNHEASYLLRFDDFCPTMKWSTWEPIESILRENDIKPIVALIPDNRDSDLYFEAPNPDFWNRVRSWQAAGWTIGIHGFQHINLTRRAGLYGYSKTSEFAGLPPTLQREKLARALTILRAEGVKSNLWVAPGHSFDRTTICVLQELGITSISDGYTRFPYTDRQGTFWIPQQELSEAHIFSLFSRKMTRLKTAGVWTVCCHQNAWTSIDIARFRQTIGSYRHLVRTVAEIQAAYSGRQIDWVDRIQAARLDLKRLLRYLRFVRRSRKGVKKPIAYRSGEGEMVAGVAREEQ